MSNRITTNMVIGSTLADINATQAALARTQRELSSGRTILEPSDNPYGASQAISLQSGLDGLAAYEGAAKDGISWLNISSSALSGIDDQVQRIRELVLQGVSGVNGPSDLSKIAGEVEQLTEGIKLEANTQYAGQYVFAGTLTNTAPYQAGENDTYQGDAGTVSRAIGPGTSVNLSVSLASALGNGQEAGDGKLLDTLRTIAQHLREGTPEAVALLGTADLKGLDTNLDTLTDLQAAAGAAGDQLNLAVSRIEALALTTSTQLSNVQDADIAKVSIDFSNEQAAFQAALRAGASIVQQSLLDFLR